MGGHHSKQTSNVTSDLITNAVLGVTQNCLAFMDGKQVISVYGSGNVFEGNIQRSQLSVNTKCVDKINQSGEFKNKLKNSISQKLKDEELALTEWLDPSGDSQGSDITQNITTNISFKNAQKCLTGLDGSQLFVVHGTNNIVVDNMQDQTLDLTNECIMDGSQAAETSNSVTNTVNQHSVYESKSPLAFITDAIAASIKSVIAIIAIVFVVIVIMALVFETGTKSEPTHSFAREGFLA